MAGVYIYSDKTDIAQEIIGFARAAGKEAILLTLSEKDAQALQNSGADKIYVIDGKSELIENYSKAIADLLTKANAEFFAVGATPRGRDLAARVAGYLDCAMVSDVSSIEYSGQNLQCVRMMYGGAVQQNEVLSGLSVVTVSAGKFETVKGEAAIQTLELEADTRVTVVETAPVVKVGVDLGKADKVVCVGMALDKVEDLQIARDLAEAVGAELGCTRSIAEERHWLPVESYIGISGAVIKPRLYMSMGVSGQIQHVYGIRDAQLIVAIDINEKAPIFKAADYGIVGDLYEVVPLLTEALKK
ncbi:MAG TPA: electron transfer flavoprotein subunit alpha/FixB family protein [Syntrophomonas sp.]|jgi:electron transfer flavoprotein alpha subunit|nr:electron transfer flavoprotein subunit alpha/FixB family protein [Syntrophomonas sp.]